MKHGLKAKYRNAIIDVLAANDNVERAVLFGSRSTEKFTSVSDVDIALFGSKLTLTDQAQLSATMENLTVPQRVDLLIFDNVKNGVLRKHIQNRGVEIYKKI